MEEIFQRIILFAVITMVVSLIGFATLIACPTAWYIYKVMPCAYKEPPNIYEFLYRLHFVPILRPPFGYLPFIPLLKYLNTSVWMVTFIRQIRSYICITSKGNIVEIMNDKEVEPKGWKVED